MQVTIDSYIDTGATVTPKDDSTVYKGDPVTVTFTLNLWYKDHLSDVVTELKLGY
jgi:hypothetical protein